jgi:hypothetical protein
MLNRTYRIQIVFVIRSVENFDSVKIVAPGITYGICLYK